jgi:DNA-binding SARP family transcriptional activator
VVECGGPRLRLAPAIAVDHQVALDRAHDITRADAGGNDQIIRALSQELLPDWADEWLILARERWNQVRMHTLETLAQQLIAERNYLSALEAAFAAVAVEPIRESAHRIVIEIYIAEGNSACAVKHYHRYRALIQRELGVTPSSRMDGLVHPLTVI